MCKTRYVRFGHTVLHWTTAEAAVPCRKAELADLKAPPETPITALEALGLARLSTKPLPSWLVLCHSGSVSHLQHGVSLPALCWLSEGGGGKPWLFPALSFHLVHFSIAACSCACFPDTFSDLPSSLLSPGRHTDPQETLQKGKGELLWLAGGLSRQQHKVPFVPPCAFDQSVEGDSTIKKQRQNNCSYWSKRQEVAPPETVCGPRRQLYCSATCLWGTGVAACLLMLALGWWEV